ncbi:condensation domain-containing protein [Aeromonas salmonicida]|uniref:Condensation domain-containing protein n=1 Tax=Aeromonas salmonicida TaxID=645 RepID=A0AAX3VPM8_AERSA|nr:condensation domain-containing protein [Aeromonas salmonicida]RSM27743.1 non ribosomal peptide synthetase BasB [Aeromonas salmonicida]WHF35434.1 condensation domain-containing protein [Aeromonas salmonicida]HEH9396113.1 non ribosomal peptide synthetase BasB [Aeromonas salmonicida]
MPLCYSEVLPEIPVSTHEENIWLLQQQHPEQVIKLLEVWRLDDKVDISLLTLTIQSLITALPDLNSRYLFSDEGDLYKYRVDGWYPCLEFIRLSSGDLDDNLGALHKSPWDSASQPPFKAFIIHVEQCVIFALMSHPILGEACCLSALVARLRDDYGTLAPHLPSLKMTKLSINSGVLAPEITNNQTEHTERDKLALILLDEFRIALSSPEMTLNDDFFDFGGHSLLATRIIGKLQNRHGIECRFNDFFESPSAAALAKKAVLNSPPQQIPSLVVENTCQQAPLALAQASLWRAYAAHDFGTIFNLPFALDFIDEVDETVFLQAFTDLIKRHPSLRTTFHVQDGQVFQRIIPVEHLGQYRWFWHSAESGGVSLANEATYQFDLSRELPIRIRFIRDVATGRQHLSFLVHHMVVDEWSINLMMEDLASAYLARATDQAPVWATPALDFHGFARQQAEQGINPRHLAYWTRMLQGAADERRKQRLCAPSEGQGSIAAQWLELKLEQGSLDSLYAFARGHDSSLFNLVYTAIAVSLHKLDGLNEIVIGTSASGRTDPAFFDTVGYFTTMVAHRVEFDEQESFGSLLRTVTHTINDSMSYADIPLEQIQQGLGMTAAEGLLFDVYVQIHANNALNGRLPTPIGEGIRYRQIDPDKTESMFGLQFEIMEDVLEGERRLRLVITYSAERYSMDWVEALCVVLNRLFGLMTSTGTSACRLADLALQKEA